MTKTIIALWGTANIGKSMTLARLGRQLQANGATTNANITGGDYRAIFQYQNKTIGLQTYGDTEHLVNQGLTEFQNQQCDIIAIASKSYGATVDTIGAFAGQNGYRIIWSSPYEVRDGSITTDTIKNYAASHLLRMVDDVIAGIL